MRELTKRVGDYRPQFCRFSGTHSWKGPTSGGTESLQSRSCMQSSERTGTTIFPALRIDRLEEWCSRQRGYGSGRLSA
jgi:hypothetical protein